MAHTSILEVCRKIHTNCTKSNEISHEEMKDLVNWLVRRVTVEWKESNKPYDKAVRALAHAALEEGRESLYFSAKSLDAFYATIKPVKAKYVKPVKR